MTCPPVWAPREQEVFDGVAALVDKSLLRPAAPVHGEPRFRMLETLREYGLECLTACGEAEDMRRAHADYYLALAETAEPALVGADQRDWLVRLEAEHENVRAALHWAEERGESERGLRLAGALCQFWLARGYLREGRKRLARLLQLGETSVPPAVRAKGLAGAGHLAHNQGDYVAARRLFEASLALWRELGDTPGIATALNDLGWVAWRQGDYTVARTLSAESLLCWRELGDTRGIATSLTNLGWTAHHQGDYTTASALHQEGLALRQEVEDPRGMALSLAFLGWTVSRQGDYARAATLLAEALALFRDMGMTQLVAFAASVLAEVAHAQEDSRRAMGLLEESVRLFRDLGDTWGHAFALSVLGTVVHAQGDARWAAALSEESLALRTAIGDTWGRATALHQLGTIAAEQGEQGRAIALYEESLRPAQKTRRQVRHRGVSRRAGGGRCGPGPGGTGGAALRDGGSTADPDWCSRVTPGACQI